MNLGLVKSLGEVSLQTLRDRDHHIGIVRVHGSVSGELSTQQLLELGA
jgi:hypothetical protein